MTEAELIEIEHRVEELRGAEFLPVCVHQQDGLKVLPCDCLCCAAARTAADVERLIAAIRKSQTVVRTMSVHGGAFTCSD